MTTMYMSAQTQTAASVGPCHCGCSECHEDCCALECPTKPNFFCGQVLTDEDLKALVDWTSAKSALQRFRHGWGVSCGLEVTCSHDPKQPARVAVEPGYAIDCCGRDIVVCEPIYYDFKCEKPFDACCPQPQQPANQTGLTSNPENQLVCIPQQELKAFDLCLKFGERQTGGRRALVRGNCTQLDQCQFTRVIETGVLSAKQVLDPCNRPKQDPDQKYRDALNGFLKELDKYTTAESLRQWVHGKLHSFCFVEDCLCERPPQNQSSQGTTPAGGQQTHQPATNLTPEQLSELRFYVLQDWRNHYFQCLCKACDEHACDGDGVPLARVWLWQKNDGTCKICKVAQIDSYPPFRRLLKRDCSPSYPDCIDLSQYIWGDVDYVHDELYRKGLKINPVTVINAADALEILKQGGKDRLCASFGSTVSVNVYVDICGRQRVVTIWS